MDFVPNAPGSYRLERIQPAGDGEVVDANGRARRLADYTGGRVTLLSFVYLSCPDPLGCPYAFMVFHQLKDRLEHDPRFHGKVRLVSLSFDPVRDTPEHLGHHAQHHGAGPGPVPWEFLTTRSVKALMPILAGYGQDVDVDLDPATGKAAGTFSHVLRVYLVDRRRQVREIYTTAFLLPDVVFNDIQTLLMEDGVEFR